jgi:uncharacterized protein YndB with AHSA1/START domain
LLTVEFRETGPGVPELTLLQEGFASRPDREGSREGWRLCLDNLDAVLEGKESVS